MVGVGGEGRGAPCRGAANAVGVADVDRGWGVTGMRMAA